MKILNKEEIKVGDIVCVERKLNIGWSAFRYGKLKKEIVTKITPKRTKFTTDGGEYDKLETFYAYDDEAIHRNEIAERMESITSCLWEFDKLNKKGKLLTLSDEQISSISQLLNEAVSKLET